MFSCKFSPELFSKLVHILTKYSAILLGEIDVLEDTVGRRDGTRLDEKSAVKAVFIQTNDFARFDLTNKFCLYSVESTGLTGNDVTAFFSLANAQRPDAIRVTGRFNVVGKQKQQTIRPLQMVQCMCQRVGIANVGRLGE